MGSNNKAISTYEITEGTFPQKYNEIVVDKAFMAKLNKKSIPGTVITLDMGAGNEEFIVTGFTDKKNTSLTYIIYTSKEFADRSPVMEKIPYEALVRLIMWMICLIPHLQRLFTRLLLVMVLTGRM